MTEDRTRNLWLLAYKTALSDVFWQEKKTRVHVVNLYFSGIIQIETAYYRWEGTGRQKNLDLVWKFSEVINKSTWEP